MISNTLSHSFTSWYWSNQATAGLARYAVQVATTPLRCAQQLYFLIEQLAHTLYAAPWTQKLPGCFTVATMGTRSIVFDLIHLLDPLYFWQMKVCHIPNQPALQWGSPFGLGKLSKLETRNELPWLSSAYPTNRLDYNITDGHCWGISLRVAQLFFEWRNSIPNAEERLISIARRFSTGAPREAQQLQALGCTQLYPQPWESAILAAQLPLRIMWTILNASTAWMRQSSFAENIHQARCRYSMAWQEGAILPFANLAIRNVQSIHVANDLANTRNGVYLVRQGFHQSHEMVYIKLSDQLSFTLNPGWGLYRHVGSNCAQKAASALGVDSNEQIHLIRVAPHNLLDCYPWALFWRWSTLFV